MHPFPKLHRAAATVAVALVAGVSTFAQPVGLWQFDESDLSATVGTSLTYRDAVTQTATMFGTTTGLGIPDINGTPANVMLFPAATNTSMGYDMPTPPANGGGLRVNEYTLLLDVLYPSSSSGRVRPIVQSDDGVITPSADLVIGSGNGIGTGEGPFFGTIAPNTWYRIGFVVHGSAYQVRMYIDGVEVGSSAIPDGFSRFSLTANATAQILNNNNSDAAPGYVNSIQLRNVALSSEQVRALGAASAAGIPETIPAVPSFIQSRSPAIDATGVGPTPNLNVVLDQGDTTINSTTIRLFLDGVQQAASVSGLTSNRYTVDYNVTTLLGPLSSHSVSLVYEDSVAGAKTNTWSFTVGDYQVDTPVISTQPVSLTVSAGGSATFTVNATGTEPLAYQWLKNGAAIGEATAASLTLNNVTSADDALYSVRISNFGGNVISAEVRLRVLIGPLGQDLVAYLKFNGDYRDYSGRGNNASPRGAPVFEAGKIGQALRVTSTADLAITNFATLGYPPDLQFGTGDFSVLFWVKIISHSSDPSFISNKDWDRSSNVGWIVSDQGSPYYLRVNCTGTPPGTGNRMDTTLAGTNLVGSWHHVASTFWRGQNTAIYLDGVLLDTQPLLVGGSVDTLTNGAPATFAVNIGQDGGGRYEGAAIDALMDDVLLYRRVVTPQEITALYTAGSAGQDLILHIVDVNASGANVTISWSGGTAPYKVERKNALTDATWTEVADTPNTTATVPTGGTTAFFRVRSN